jgi:hypothetical protein
MDYRIASADQLLTYSAGAAVRFRRLGWLSVGAIACALAVSACSDDSPTSPSATPTGPPAAVAQSPTTAGIAGVTTFGFTVQNVTPRPGATLRYSWEFGDGTAETGAAATVTHVYQSPGTFAVRVLATDTAAGVIDTATASGVRVVSLTGSWGIRAPGGPLRVDRGMFLSQSGNTLRGDITYIAGCLVAINGTVSDAGVMNLAFTLPPSNGCRPFPLPIPSSFVGTADVDMSAFSGDLSGVGGTVVSRCADNTTVVNCR